MSKSNFKQLKEEKQFESKKIIDEEIVKPIEGGDYIANNNDNNNINSIENENDYSHYNLQESVIEEMDEPVLDMKEYYYYLGLKAVKRENHNEVLETEKSSYTHPSMNKQNKTQNQMMFPSSTSNITNTISSPNYIDNSTYIVLNNNNFSVPNGYNYYGGMSTSSSGLSPTGMNWYGMNQNQNQKPNQINWYNGMSGNELTGMNNTMHNMSNSTNNTGYLNSNLNNVSYYNNYSGMGNVNYMSNLTGSMNTMNNFNYMNGFNNPNSFNNLNNFNNLNTTNNINNTTISNVNTNPNFNPNFNNNFNNNLSNSYYRYPINPIPLPLSLQTSNIQPLLSQSLLTVNQIELQNKLNTSLFIKDTKHSKFIIIKSIDEDSIIKSIKFSLWSSTQKGNQKINKIFKDSNQNLLMFFSINNSGRFLGVAKVVKELDTGLNLENTGYKDKWRGFFRIQWLIIKNIDNGLIKSIINKLNEGKSVVSSKDSQEVDHDAGIDMLTAFNTAEYDGSIVEEAEFDYSNSSFYQQNLAKILKADEEYKKNLKK